MSEVLNRGDFSDLLYEKLSLTRKEIDEVVKTVFDVLQGEVVAGNVVNITGFGKFTPRTRVARTTRNPQKPGETVNVPERKGVSFKAGKTFKEALNAWMTTS